MGKQKCATCGKTGGLSKYDMVWIYNYQVKVKWEKHTNAGLWLCEVCKDERWYECEECGGSDDQLVLIEKDNYGAGYLSDEYAGPLICPECWDALDDEYELNSE